MNDDKENGAGVWVILLSKIRAKSRNCLINPYVPRRGLQPVYHVHDGFSWSENWDLAKMFESEDAAEQFVLTMGLWATAPGRFEIKELSVDQRNDIEDYLDRGKDGKARTRAGLEP